MVYEQPMSRTTNIKTILLTVFHHKILVINSRFVNVNNWIRCYIRNA